MMTKRQRREIDAALKTEIASEEVQASVADLARYEVRPNQIYAWKTQPLEQAARGIDGGAGLDAEPRHRRVYPASFRGPCTLVECTCRPADHSLRRARHSSCLVVCPQHWLAVRDHAGSCT
jgi:transposase-like protein